MSIVLIGINKPQSGCSACDLYEYGGSDDECVCLATYKSVDPKTVSEKCPMRQLPRKHGSLIDKDELLRRIEESGNYLSPAIRAYIEMSKVIVEPEVNDE